MTNQEQDHPVCNNFDCFEKNKNKQVIIEGVFRKYTPWKTGKGANYMYWDWEVLLTDGVAIPAISNNKALDLSLYENKNVSIDGAIFYGIIIGSSNPQEQSARGYRIDINSIREN